MKREASKASLRRPLWNQIQTPTDLFDFCQENIRGIETYYVTDNEVNKAYEAYLKERFSKSNTVKGTKKFHSFKNSGRHLVCKQTSFDEEVYIHKSKA